MADFMQEGPSLAVMFVTICSGSVCGTNPVLTTKGTKVHEGKPLLTKPLCDFVSFVVDCLCGHQPVRYLQLRGNLAYPSLNR